MATVAGIKIKTKVSKPKGSTLMDEKHTGSEPIWPEDAIAWPDEQFDNYLRKSFNFYNYYYTIKSGKPYVVTWMERSGLYNKEQIRRFERASERQLPMTACSLAMAHQVGMPLKPRHIEFINKYITLILNDAAPDVVDTVTPAVAAAKPTIQDRLAEKTSELIGELEGKYDDMESFKAYDWFISNNVVQGQLSRYEEVYGKRKAELELAQSKEDAQLKEAYSHYKAADFKKRIAWIDALMDAVEQYRSVKKATKKARVKKAPSKEKLVAKLKYAKNNAELKIVSINPADIIGTTELWVYNAKTRKLGKYVAATYQTLNIKGTSLTGFDTDKSVCKTLRKPAEQLKEFAKAGKIQLRKFLDDIKATETKMNGRINADILLLKVA